MHLSAAFCTNGFVFDCLASGFRCELSAANQAKKALFAVLGLSVFIEGAGIAFGTIYPFQSFRPDCLSHGIILAARPLPLCDGLVTIALNDQCARIKAR